MNNDSELSFNLNNEDSEEETNADMQSELSLSRMKFGKYKLENMLRLFWSTCAWASSKSMNKAPYINIIVHKLNNNPFKDHK